MFKSIKNKIKNTGILGNSSYGKTWQEREGNKQNDWYDQMHESHKIQHQDFIQYLKTRKNLETVLEVGCGTGVYPIKLKELFSNIIEEVRGINFIKGLKLKVDNNDFMSKLMKHKLLVVKASENCIRLFPSLLSTTDELDMGIKIIRKVCDQLN